LDSFSNVQMTTTWVPALSGIRYIVDSSKVADEPTGLASPARPALGLDAGDRKKDRARGIRPKVHTDLMAYAEVADFPELIPELVLHPGNVFGSPVVPIRYSGLSKIANKFGRRCEYRLRNRYVEPPYGLRSFIGHRDEIRAEFDGEQLFDLGPRVQGQMRLRY
jgi:hypothetical protein